MDELDMRKERFARIMAEGKVSAAEACQRAGYASARPGRIDSQIKQQAARLMSNPNVLRRIHELKEKNAQEELEYKEVLINRLKYIIGANYLEYYETLESKHGEHVTQYNALKTHIQDWDPEYAKACVNGFDSKGNPKLIDKQWAIDRMLKLTGLLKDDNGTDTEDKDSLYAKAGLPTEDVTEDDIAED